MDIEPAFRIHILYCKFLHTGHIDFPGYIHMKWLCESEVQQCAAKL